MGQLAAVIFILVLVSTHHLTAGDVHDPLLVLDGYEDDGIRLKCFSVRLFSEVQVLWTDGRGDNLTGTPLTTDTTTANASSSIILKPESGNFVSCKIIDKLLKTSTESSVVIASEYELVSLCHGRKNSDLLHTGQIAPGTQISRGTE
ncbi:butyrophilin subfamily 3 member a2-like isoform x1 [Limosa lapponica baueri]|uniref:Butyrophilin subfamily 3 member a2-like isoform x1 n=1 Tax=Limosa lapponica baueri TaxID=1758121 RepID=A0A2I0T6Z8_LIMLA|nr:butyrophilin subfamily 3 member a2-like isoform x1 [Limosa lapponica baueri]